MLPLTFANPADYDKINPDDRVDIIGLAEFQEGVPLTLRVHPKNGQVWDAVRLPFLNLHPFRFANVSLEIEPYIQ
jgi:hypothetical protein